MPADGILSIDQAVTELNNTREESAPDDARSSSPETVTATVAEEGNQEHDANAQVDQQPDTEAEPDEAAAEGDEAQPEPAAPAVEPPQFWSADAKAKFATLPPELQQVVVEQARAGESVVGKARQEAVEARKKADAELQNVSQVSQALQHWLPQATQTFKSRWDDVDWVTWAREDPQAATAAKFQHDEELRQLTATQQAAQQAQEIERRRLNEAEAERLKEVAPHLADPKDGPKRKQELAQYLVTNGVPQDQLPNISAIAASLAYKAMLYDRAQAGLRTPPRKEAAPAPKTARPTAAQTGTPATREVDRAKNSFVQKPSIDAAVALLTARGST